MQQHPAVAYLFLVRRCPVTIDYLAQHPDFIPTVAQETFDHYRDILRDETLEMRFAKLREALTRHYVEQVL